MKPRIVLTFAVVAGCLACASVSEAAVPAKLVVAGQEIKSDWQPIVEGGRTLVPMRALTDALGATLSWNAQTKTAVVGKWSETARMTANRDVVQFEKNGQTGKLELDAPVRLVEGRVYVPLRFLSQFFGYRVAADGTSVSVDAPLSAEEINLLENGDLAEARQFVMDRATQSAHYAEAPIPYVSEREGFEFTYLFPLGESTRFYLIATDGVAYYELQDGFFVATWQAHVPVGTEDTDTLFLKGKVTNAVGKHPALDKPFFFFRRSGLVSITNITAWQDGT